jgi:hypothetical protein
MKSIIFSMVLLFCILMSPFVSWGWGHGYDRVIADAAEHFGIDLATDNIRVIFTDKPILSAAGEANGLMAPERDDRANLIGYTITVQKSFSRPWVIATIFHEFAHVAQHKYALDPRDYSREQHAEILAFSALWHSPYWWNATHMLIMHSCHFKPKNYIAAGALWNTAATGKSIGGVK